MIARSLVLTLCLVLGALLIGRASTSERVPPRETLATFPIDVKEWHGRPTERFDQQVLTVLGVDEYLNRTYTAADGVEVGLYVGYYQSRREGSTIHSPLNCLPGSGWQPVKEDRITLQVQTDAGGSAVRDIGVNRLLIEKDLDRQVVVYWYQSHGRVVASEYLGQALHGHRRHATEPHGRRPGAGDQPGRR